MRCLKCGKETEDNRNFCDRCRDTMRNYPVRMDAQVHLPHRPQASQVKKQTNRKKAPTPEEQILAMQRMIRRLIVALLAVSLLFVLCVAALIHNHKETEAAPTAIGRNYTVETDETQ